MSETLPLPCTETGEFNPSACREMARIFRPDAQTGDISDKSIADVIEKSNLKNTPQGCTCDCCHDETLEAIGIHSRKDLENLFDGEVTYQDAVMKNCSSMFY